MPKSEWEVNDELHTRNVGILMLLVCDLGGAYTVSITIKDSGEMQIFSRECFSTVEEAKQIAEDAARQHATDILKDLE
jgi:hypothetical protein